MKGTKTITDQTLESKYISRFLDTTCEELSFNERKRILESEGIAISSGMKFFNDNLKSQHMPIREYSVSTFDCPDVSVIVPVYNSSRYLHQCLNSIQSQTIENIEIICVDDGSTDDSLAILNQYSAVDKRFHVITQKNSHAGIARNKGLEIAKAKYVAFFDSDDEYVPDCLERMLYLCKNNDLDFVKGAFWRMNVMDGTINMDSYTMLENHTPHNKVLAFKDDPKTIIRLPDIPWNALYKKEFLDTYSIRFNNLEVSNDHSFFVECAVHANRVMISDIYTTFHRIQRSSSLIGRKIERFHCQLDSHRIVEDKVSFLEPEYKKIVLLRELDHTLLWYYRLLNIANKSQKNDIKAQMKSFTDNLDISLVGRSEYQNILIRRWLIYNLGLDIGKNKLLKDVTRSIKRIRRFTKRILRLQ